ncbi:hydantoinase/oxoprolinase family protein [Candidatus Puniceispirillum sp.]|nr:hydantoinase/oxoprolinase family protein [Candidatus Puniceispirillum sp.]
MSLVIGLDTGGTYTDAALLNVDQGDVLATSKALTTHDDLSIGLGNAIAKVLKAYNGKADNISLVSLSTTLATNAVVEGVGGRIGLLMIGFDDAALQRADLARAIGRDPFYFIDGGHKPDGSIQLPLDIASLETIANKLKSEVSAFAVAGHFATRNPLHETQACNILRDITHLPVTCSHELSSSLGGPRRALTAVLNARLISILERLITATQCIMTQQGLTCPLMVVKGDGSLLQADFALSRPVETILSGPAASLSGAAFLAGAKSALVADIGGTTTDIAFLKNGTHRLKKDGAVVGGWQTMVEAAEIRTCGIGGDSEVTLNLRGRSGGLTLGPRRVVPLSLSAIRWPIIKDYLASQLALPVANTTDAQFVFPIMPNGVPKWLTRSESRIAKKAISNGFSPVGKIASTQLTLGSVGRLVSRGLLGICGFTPTDATHVIGSFKEFDSEAAMLGAKLLARQRNGAGEVIADTPNMLAEMILNELHRSSSLALVDAAMAHEGSSEKISLNNPILANAFDEEASNICRLVSVGVTLNTNLIALGASAATHYPQIAKNLATNLIVPDNANVAGAVGAAAGSVQQRVLISITQPYKSKFRIHLPDGPIDRASLEEALATSRIAATELAKERAQNAGAITVDVKLDEEIKLVALSTGENLFIEAVIYATAQGHASRR